MGVDFNIGLEDSKPVFFLNASDWDASLASVKDFREKQAGVLSAKIDSSLAGLKLDAGLFLADVSTVINTASAIHHMIVQKVKGQYDRIPQAVAHGLVDLYGEVVAQDALLKDVYGALAGSKSQAHLMPRLDSLLFGCRRIVESFAAAMLDHFEIVHFAPLIDQLKGMVSRPEYSSFAAETEAFIARGQY